MMFLLSAVIMVNTSLSCYTWLSSMSNSCNVDAGDRLLSVNDVNLQGLSHATTVDILQNAPDDITLVVSQPKERLYKGKSSAEKRALPVFSLMPRPVD